MRDMTGKKSDPHNAAVAAALDAGMFRNPGQVKDGHRLIGTVGFYNFGYWKGVGDSFEMAQINLIETLVDFFEKKDGNILDVACGKGASSRFLMKYFDPLDIVGINISERQLDVCRLWAPECQFKLMDAADLQFPDSSFDNILCIEAAPHFKTRHRFLQEAHRVLKPGGRLAMSDLLYDRDDFLPSIHPKENYLPSFDAYEDELNSVGFISIRIEDITEHSVRAVDRMLFGTTTPEIYEQADRETLQNLMKSRCCLVYAIK